MNQASAVAAAAIARRREAYRGRRHHAHITKSGSSAAFLLRFCAISGDLPYTLRLFNDISTKDTFSYNIILTTLSRFPSAVAGAAVLRLLNSMLSDGLSPNPHTFSAAISAVCNPPVLSSGQQIHALFLKHHSPTSNLYVSSTLLNLYCKSASLSDAHTLFYSIPNPNSFSFVTLLCGYSSLRFSSQSLHLFLTYRRYVQTQKEREEENEEGEEKESEFAYTSVLSSLCTSEFQKEGEEIHGLCVKSGMVSFVAVGNALVSMYSRCNNLGSAVHLFYTSVGEKNSVTWSAMITGLSHGGSHEKALNLFSTMHSSCVTPTEFTIVGVLNSASDAHLLRAGVQTHAYIIKLGFSRQIFVTTALLDMYAKCGASFEARKCFEDSMKEPDTVLWTAMVAGHVVNGEEEDALSLYSVMEGEGVVSNELTMASVLKACAGLAALEQGRQVHSRVVKYGLSRRVSVGSAVATMYVKCGSLEEGEKAFRRMEERDVVAWNAMISGLSQNGKGVEAIGLFEEMRGEGRMPDSVTFVNLLSACSHAGEVELGRRYYEAMDEEFGVRKGVEHRACMIDMLTKAGRIEEAKEFIEREGGEDGVWLWRIVMGACRNQGRYEEGVEAGEKVLESGTSESSSYVQLSSMYLAMGKKDDAKRVWRLMREKGVSKETGCSWIEVGGRVSVFVVGDGVHPCVDEIRRELRLLVKLMRDEGYMPLLECSESH